MFNARASLVRSALQDLFLFHLTTLPCDGAAIKSLLARHFFFPLLPLFNFEGYTYFRIDELLLGANALPLQGMGLLVGYKDLSPPILFLKYGLSYNWKVMYRKTRLSHSFGCTVITLIVYIPANLLPVGH